MPASEAAAPLPSLDIADQRIRVCACVRVGRWISVCMRERVCVCERKYILRGKNNLIIQLLSLPRKYTRHALTRCRRRRRRPREPQRPWRRLRRPSRRRRRGRRACAPSSGRAGTRRSSSRRRPTRRHEPHRVRPPVGRGAPHPSHSFAGAARSCCACACCATCCSRSEGG